MKWITAYTSMISGALLLILPRFILPACEYEGFSRMHCSDTALAEYALGAALLATGGLVLVVKRSWAPFAGAVLSCLLLAAAWIMPEVFGYCANRKMPCHYGMVPGIRFMTVIALIVQSGSVVFLLQARKKQ